MQHRFSIACLALCLFCCEDSLLAQDRLFVVASSVEKPQQNASRVQRFGVTRNDWHWLQQAFPNQEVIAQRTVAASVRRGERTTNAAIVGCTERLAAVADIDVVRGTFISGADNRRSNNVCVVSRSVANRVVGGLDPLGKQIRIERNYYTVIGVCGPPKVSLITANKQDFDDFVFIPLAAMRSRMGHSHVTRQTGQFTVKQFELSQIWIPGSEDAVVKNTLRQLREPEDPHDDYEIGFRRGF